jgi:hypothetical protein
MIIDAAVIFWKKSQSDESELEGEVGGQIKCAKTMCLAGFSFQGLIPFPYVLEGLSFLEHYWKTKVPSFD